MITLAFFLLLFPNLTILRCLLLLLCASPPPDEYDWVLHRIENNLYLPKILFPKIAWDIGISINSSVPPR